MSVVTDLDLKVAGVQLDKDTRHEMKHDFSANIAYSKTLQRAVEPGQWVIRCVAVKDP